MNRNREIKILATATLIRRVRERCGLAEIYDKAVRCHETLIDSIQKSSTSKEISDLLGIPEAEIKGYAEDIINILLFNQEKDPYLSFGLMQGAPLREVNRKWKSLIALYHPDKYADKKTSEEKTMQIIEIRNKITALQAKKNYFTLPKNISAIHRPQRCSTGNIKNLKCLPLVIIATAIMISIFSIFLIIFGQILT